MYLNCVLYLQLCIVYCICIKNSYHENRYLICWWHVLSLVMYLTQYSTSTNFVGKIFGEMVLWNIGMMNPIWTWNSILNAFWRCISNHTLHCQKLPPISQSICSIWYIHNANYIFCMLHSKIPLANRCNSPNSPNFFTTRIFYYPVSWILSPQHTFWTIHVYYSLYQTTHVYESWWN